MAFTPITWKSGDAITPKKLNRLENAVNNSLIVEGTKSENQTTLNATYNDIYNAVKAGKNIIIKVDNIYENIISGSQNDSYCEIKTDQNTYYSEDGPDSLLLTSEVN